MTTLGNDEQPTGTPTRALELAHRNSSLVKAGEVICPNLSVEQTSFVEAAYGEKIGKMDKGTALVQLLDIVSIALAELNQVPAGNTEVEQNESVRVVTKLIYADLMHYYPRVTMDEILWAVKNGTRRQYGEFYGFNALSVHRFIEKYLENEERMEAIKKQVRFLEAHEEPQKEPTPEEEEMMNRNSLKRCYDDYMETGNVYDCGSIIYRYVVRKGLVKMTLEEMNEIYNMAMLRVKAKKLTDNQRMLYSFNKRTEADKIAFSAKLLAREMVLANYFNSLGKECRWEFLKDIEEITINKSTDVA